MEDLRITKTRKKLRQALCALLAEKPFEQITVTDLCRMSGVSRITFYAYYDDKFALVRETFDALLAQTTAIFAARERRNNAARDPAQSGRNLLDAILDMQEQEDGPMRTLLASGDAYLSFAYYWQVLCRATLKSEGIVAALGPVYPATMTNSLLCSGLWGFLRTGFREQRPPAELRAQAQALLDGLLKSALFNPSAAPDAAK